MKKTAKLLVMIFCILIATGCKSVGLKEIKYSDLEKAIKNKESFILEVVQDGCSNCESFTPKFEKILNKYKLSAKQINLKKLSEKENNSFSNLYNVSGTPTVIFIDKGEEISITRRIVGDVSEDKVISKLKVAGYIK